MDEPRSDLVVPPLDPQPAMAKGSEKVFFTDECYSLVYRSSGRYLSQRLPPGKRSLLFKVGLQFLLAKRVPTNIEFINEIRSGIAFGACYCASVRSFWRLLLYLELRLHPTVEQVLNSKVYKVAECNDQLRRVRVTVSPFSKVVHVVDDTKGVYLREALKGMNLKSVLGSEPPPPALSDEPQPAFTKPTPAQQLFAGAEGLREGDSQYYVPEVQPPSDPSVVPAMRPQKKPVPVSLQKDSPAKDFFGDVYFGQGRTGYTDRHAHLWQDKPVWSCHSQEHTKSKHQGKSTGLDQQSGCVGQVARDLEKRVWRFGSKQPPDSSAGLHPQAGRLEEPVTLGQVIDRIRELITFGQIQVAFTAFCIVLFEYFAHFLAKFGKKPHTL